MFVISFPPLVSGCLVTAPLYMLTVKPFTTVRTGSAWSLLRIDLRTMVGLRNHIIVGGLPKFRAAVAPLTPLVNFAEEQVRTVKERLHQV